MSSLELSQGLDLFFYVIGKFREASCGKSKSLILISLVMPTVQVVCVFLLFDVSFDIIYNTDDILNLVQNFAGLYVILEFDEITFRFIHLFPWRSFLQIILRTKILWLGSIMSIFSG